MDLPEITREKLIYEKIAFECVHSGKPRTDSKKDNSRKTSSMRIGCEFRIYCKYEEMRNGLVIAKINIKHCHETNANLFKQ